MVEIEKWKQVYMTTNIPDNNGNYYYIIIHIKMENHIQFFFEKLFIPLIEINKCVCELVYNKNTDSTIL